MANGPTGDLDKVGALIEALGRGAEETKTITDALAQSLRDAGDYAAAEAIRRTQSFEEEKAQLGELKALTDSIADAKRRLALEEAQGNDTQAESLRNLIATEQERLRVAAAGRNAMDMNKKSIDSMVSGLNNLMPTLSKRPRGVMGSFLSNPKLAAQGLKSFVKGINPLFAVVNTIMMLSDASIKLSLEQDKAAVSFNRLTGQSGQFNSVIMQSTQELALAGIAAEDVSRSFTSLFKNVSEFSKLGPTLQREVGQTTALLGKLGVNADSVAKNIQIATKALNMNVSEAANLQTRFFSLANTLGLSADQVSRDFATASKSLSALGNSGNAATNAFAMLQAQIKATGLEMNTILSITDQFDKFDTGAQAVGKLNAILGGPFLSTIDMINNADPSARLRMLAEALDDAGKNFDTMSYYERKAVADAAGLKDVNDLAMLMSGNLGSLQAPQMDSQSIQDMKNLSAEFNTVMQELRQTGMALTVTFGPLLTMIKHLAQALQTALSPMQNMVSSFGDLNKSIYKRQSPSLLDSLAMASDGLKEISVDAKVSSVSTQGLNTKLASTKMQAAEVGTRMSTAAAAQSAVQTNVTNNVAGLPEGVKFHIKIGDRDFGEFVADAVSDPLGRTKKEIGNLLDSGRRT
jgi:hypothetical protein